MPTGLQGERRPADVIGNAVDVAKVASGEADEAPLPTAFGCASRPLLP